MIYLTLSDKNYLLKGLTLFESLKSHNPNTKLYYVCLDDESYEVLKNIYGIIAISIKEFERKFPKEMEIAKNNPASKYGNQWSQFCWTMTPFSICALLHELKEDVMYLDSDLYFYHSPELISKEVGEKSIGLHTHRFSSFDINKQNVGEFNVGAVLLRYTEVGKKASLQWAEWLLNPQNEYASLYGQCGDQAYLCLFKPLFGEENICVFDKNLSHGAPWCFGAVQYKSFGKVAYKGQDQPLVFNHFSHFNPYFNMNNWRSSNENEWKPEVDRNVKIYYDHYFEQMKMVKEKYNL